MACVPSVRAPVPAMTDIIPGEPLVSFKDVYIQFDEGEILRGISFHVLPNETKVLLGVNGSGKTVLMKLAAGLLRPTKGQVIVMGRNLGEMSEDELLSFRRNLGFVFQEGALFDSLSVVDNVAFRLSEEKVPENEIESRVRQALRFVELESAIGKYPSELSGGMQRRVSIARALVDNPLLVFYDSPTAGLDPVTSQTIINLIMRGRDLQGVTSLIATHRVQDAFGLANFRFDKERGHVVPSSGNGATPGKTPTNVLVLRDGKIYFQGTADAVLHSTDAYLKEFLASAE